ncbi:Uncharacterised protein [Mycobacteroides abscessus subsp. abscessus]|nr:Uncharacterised protein [Mycobacteroides abscessus subsp. abscessus]
MTADPTKAIAHTRLPRWKKWVVDPRSAGIAASCDTGPAMRGVESEAPLTDPRLGKLSDGLVLTATNIDSDGGSGSIGIALVNGPA